MADNAPVVAIYFSDVELMGYPFDIPQYFETYQQIIKQLEQRGIEVCIVRGDSYQGKGVFSTGSKVQSGVVVAVDRPIQATIIFNRDDKNTIPVIADCPIVNHPELDRLCIDKLATARMFPEYSPKVEPIGNYTEYQDIIRQWKLKDEDMVVLKKNFETSGRGIFIQPAGTISQGTYTSWDDVLVQEFLDSSVGIPSLVQGPHDLRITTVNSVPINAYIRTPAKGKLLANIAQGGRGQSVTIDQLPAEVMTCATAIIDQLKKYNPSAYSIDFIHSAKGYALIELNSRPGVQHPSWSSTYQLFTNAIVDMLTEACHL